MSDQDMTVLDNVEFANDQHRIWVLFDDDGYVDAAGATSFASGGKVAVQHEFGTKTFDWDNLHAYKLIGDVLMIDQAKASGELLWRQRESAARELMNERLVRILLANASDEEIVTLTPLLPQWQPNTEYDRYDVVQYKRSPYYALRKISAISNSTPGTIAAKNDWGGYNA